MHQQAAVKGDGRTFTIAHIALGELLQRKRSNVQAKSCFLTALELNDTQVQANQGLVAIYLDEGNELEAVTNAATFIEACYPRRSGVEVVVEVGPVAVEVGLVAVEVGLVVVVEVVEMGAMEMINKQQHGRK